MKKIILTLIATTILTGCGVQSLPQGKNEVDSKLADVTNEYKRRTDLVPNLVNVVKGYASHEKQTLEGVVEARAKATQMTIDPSKVTPDQLAAFSKAQGQLSQALGRLMVLQEQYPNLKADTQFIGLQKQLEGTENRITVSRTRYIEAIRDFNNLVTVPPTSWTNSLFYHFEKMPQWDVSADEKPNIDKAPKVQF